MHQDSEHSDSSELRQRAKASIQTAKEAILESIPNDDIVSIYVKGSFVQGEMLPDSDVDVVVILKSEEYLPVVYKITEEHGNSVNPPFQIVAYTMKELETGEKASNRIKSTTAVSRFVKHLDFLPLIYGTRPEGRLFSRTDLKDLSINIRNFRERFIPEYKEDKLKFREILKQVFWLVEGEQRLKGMNHGYSWQGLADSTNDPEALIHLALRYRRQAEISRQEEDEFMKKLDEYLSSLSQLLGSAEQIAFHHISWDNRDMKTRSTVKLISAAVLLGALVFLGATWWANGRDETWLYAVCAVIVLTSFASIFSKKNQGNDQ